MRVRGFVRLAVCGGVLGAFRPRMGTLPMPHVLLIRANVPESGFLEEFVKLTVRRSALAAVGIGYGSMSLPPVVIICAFVPEGWALRRIL